MYEKQQESTVTVLQYLFSKQDVLIVPQSLYTVWTCFQSWSSVIKKIKKTIVLSFSHERPKTFKTTWLMCGLFAPVVAHLFCNFSPVSHSLHVESLSLANMLSLIFTGVFKENEHWIKSPMSTMEKRLN